MLRVGSITPRTGQLLIALLLLVKLLLLVWNAAVFDGRSFDTEYHADRAVFGGLKASRTTHDGPLYYLPARLAPRPYGVEPIERATAAEEGEPQDVRAERPPRLARAEKAYRAELLDLLRYTNVLWLGAFYGLWIYWLFPRLLRGFQPWFLASLLLLALPGYQKLGVVAHPDNLFAATSALSL
ncbi:MAG TPA: hypothetical protein VEQ59_23690, partial [Polyangiaceae bacterium]|nr:hypothetical protein [Polyangiaceae bacterium]